MMHSTKNFVCVFLSVLVVLDASKTTMANENVRAVITGNNKMTGQLYRQVAKPNENLIMSPLSVHTILSLAYQGAKADTEDAFRKVLNVPDKARTADGFQNVMGQLKNVPNVTLDIANRIYVKQGYALKPAFKEVAVKKFFSEAENIKFTEPTAAAKINGWVEGMTKNKIKNLIQQGDLDPDTRLVLVNAIYFKGNWEKKFRKELTKKDKFYISETATVPCDMMFRSGQYSYKEDDGLDAQIIELPYENPALSMVIVLPKTKTGITELEKKLVDYDLDELTKGMMKVDVELSLPRFKIESTLELNDPLKNMGLGVAFTDAANFSGMLDSAEPLAISKVVQKAFIEVNEEGAEAAAATGVSFGPQSFDAAPPPRKKFVANRAFLYSIRANEKEMFVGRLQSPQRK